MIMEEFIEESEIVDDSATYTKYEMYKGEDGKFSKTILNLVSAFYIDENLKKLFIYNEFSGCVEYAKDAIWHGIKKGQELRDKDIVFVQYYLAHNKKFEMPTSKITNALVEIAERNRYHPIRRYLNTLKWDGIKRLDEWLIKTCGAEDNIYTRAIGAKFLMAAVGRVYCPGIKFDNVLILEGEENIGKSTVFRILGEPWFCDSVDLLQDDKQIIEKMQGHWFLEMAELVGMKDKDQEWVTSFLSRQIDVQRLSYERRAEKFKRQSVFCASSNKLAYLFREDGNRRWWPVKCNQLDLSWLRENKEQLFAEAKIRLRNGENLFLNEAEFLFAKKVQSLKLSVNEVWMEVVDKYLLGKDEITMREVLKDCLLLDLKDLNNVSFTMNVGRILKRLGFEKKQRRNYAGERFVYVREGSVADREKKRLSEEDLEEPAVMPVTTEQWEE